MSTPVAEEISMPNHAWQTPRRYTDFDYSSAGAYFITACLYARVPLFAETVSETDVILTEAGKMVDATWLSIPTKFAGIELDDHIVMPDHIHGIIHLGTDPEIPSDVFLSNVMRWFKTMSTNRYIRGVKQSGWSTYDRYLWQRNYYDRIIRNDRELEDRRKYIERNPWRWWEKHSQ
jgi:REP element-mobilizing transposase RayT